MHSSSAVAILATLTHLVQGVPVISRASKTGCAAGIVGAAYIQTNAINGANAVMAIPMNAQGLLQQPVVMHGTGGMGGVGTVANVTAGTAHADALFSQDSVRVQGNNLFVVNAGSNTVSMFAIDPKCPTRLSLKSTMSSGGDFPSAVAINSNGTMACVLNSGQQNGIMCAAVSKAGLTPQGTLLSTALNQTTPPNGPGGTPSDLIFDNQGNLLVSVKGTSPAAPGFLGVVAMTNGVPSSITQNAPTGGAITFSMTALPANVGSGNIVLSTDPAVGAVAFDVGANGTATSVPTAIGGNGATCWSDFSPVTNSVFTSDVTANQISEVAIDPKTLNGTVVSQTQIGAAAGTIDLRVAQMKTGQNMLLVTNAGNQSVTVMKLAAGGKSTVVQNFNLQKVGKGAKLTQSIQGMDVKMI